MKLEIGESYQDILIFVDLLKGRHVVPRREKVAEIVTSVLVGGAVVGSCAGALLREPDLEGIYVIGLITMIVVGAGYAIAMTARACAEYRISSSGVVKHLPLRGSAWSIPVDTIHHINLEFRGDGVLSIHTTSDSERRMPLLPSMRAALVTIYPWLRPGKLPELPRRWAYVAYGLLGVVGVATIIMFWVLGAKGLLAWR